jgi:hypothetical protein
MATVHSLIRVQFVVSQVARESPTTVDPCSCSLRYTTKPDPVSQGPTPQLAPNNDVSMTFLYDVMIFVCTR